MAWFKKRTGGQKVKLTAAQKKVFDIMKAYESFTKARDALEQRKIVKAHPELLSEQADQFLSLLSNEMHQRGKEDTHRNLEDHRNLFRQCRESGVDRAFFEKR